MSLFQGLAILALMLLSCVPTEAAPSRPFAVEVVDEETGRGVPLVELKTTHFVRYYTDSNGIAAIDEPGLVGQSVFFTISSHGYEMKADGFGMRGVALKVEPGKTATVKIRRINLAERLYRLTGEGIYRDSLIIGRKAPTKRPLLNAQVMGSDSVQNAVYKGRLFWMWGDTSKPSYPLGNFHMTGATTPLPGGGLNPDRGIDLEYFTAPSGFTREMAPVPGNGPTWLDGLVVLNEGGRERLYAAYSKIRPPLAVYERGLVRFEDEKGRFEPVVKFPLHAPILPFGHPVKRRENGTEYVYFGDPFPLVRVRATSNAFRDPSQYEAYTPLREGSRLNATDLDRDEKGAVRYAWRRNTPPVGHEAQERLIREGKLRREEALLQFNDPQSNKPVVLHRGTVRWNAYRKRWIMIATEIGGSSSHLGEVWYAEADQPLGPWLNLRKVVTHDKYSFYNPVHHPEFDEQGGRMIYFEGTYTNSFSGNPDQTPRYDYNQVMYRLDLGSSRMALPKS